MAQINAAMIKELREKTGAGMLDCKKALDESNCDLQAAIDILRKKGLSAAAKKSGRITSEGLVASMISDDLLQGALLEVNCETDFVARNPDFQAYVSDVLAQVNQFDPQGVKAEEGDNALENQKWIRDESKTVKEATSELIGTIGENISPRRFVRWTVQGEGRLNTYIHMGGKLGVLVEIGCGKDIATHPAVEQFGKQVGMQIAAAFPIALERGDISEDLLSREREIARTQAIESGKPEKIMEKIVEGKVNKFYKENCLLEQEWVHDTSMTVTKAMAAAAKEAGGDITLRRYARYQLGEGLEKRSTDLVGEVAAQLEGK